MCLNNFVKDKTGKRQIQKTAQKERGKERFQQRGKKKAPPERSLNTT